MDKYLEKELLQQAESISNFGIWELDLKTNSLYWSDGVFKLCGYEPQEFEVTFEKGLGIIHPDDQKRAIEHMQNTITTGEPYEIIKRFVTKDNSIKYINSRARLIKDDHGNPKKLYGVFQDITHTIKLEDEINKTVSELKERNQFIETILNNLPIGIAVNKIDTGEATVVNNQFSAAYGWTNKDLTDVTGFFQKIYPDEKYRAEITERIIGDIQSGDASKMNWAGIKVTASNGQHKFVDAKNIPLYDQSLMISTVVDVTEKTNLEIEKNEINANIKALIENTPDIIYSIDLNFNLLTYNSAFEKLVRKLGLGKVTKGVNVFEFYSDEKRELYSAVFLIVKEGNRYAFEDEIIVGGQSVFFDVSVNPIQNEKNEIIGVSIFSKDVTEKNQKEREIERIKVNQEYVINSTSDLIWSINSKMELITANNAFYKLIKESTGREIKPGDLIMVPEYPLEINKVWFDFYKRGLSGEAFTEDYIDSFSGDPVYNLLSFSPMYNAEHEVWGLACYCKNITKEKLNFLELEKKELELKKIMDSSMDVICTFNKASEFVKVNAASEKVWGYKPEELIGKHYNLLVHPDDINLTNTTSEEIQEGISASNFENRNVKKDGTIITMLWSASYDKDEELTYCIAKDISLLKSRDEEIKRTNAILKNAQKLAKIGNYELNLETNEVFCSDEIYNIYEIDRNKEPITTPLDFLNLSHPDDLETVKEFRNKLVETGEISTILHRIITKKGKLKYVRQVVELVYDEKTKSKWLYGTVRDATSNVVAQQELENSNEKYRYLFDNNPSVMFVFDFETLKIIDCNQEALELYGYTREEFLKLNIRDIRPSEDVALINIATQNEDTYGNVHKDTWRHQNKKGEIIYVNVNGHLVDIDGRRCSLVQVTNITEKLKADEATKASEKQRELIMNAALDAIICIDTKGNIIFWNPQAENIFGYSVNEVMGQNLTQLIVPQIHRSGHDAGMKHYLKTKEGPVLNKLLELSAINKEGKEFPIELTVIPISEGKDEFFCSFIRDISIRKNIEFELKESEKKYRLLFQNSPLPKWIYSLDDFMFIDVNETAIKHYGYTREEFLRMGLKDIKPSEDLSKLLAVQETTIDRQGVISFGVFNHLKKDKTSIKVELSGQKVNYLGKDCMMVLCNDVTEREKALEQLKDKEAKLLKAQKIAKLGYWQLDIENNKTFWSSEIFNIWERNPADGEPDFETFLETVHPDDRLHFIHQQNEAILNESGLDIEHRIVLPNNKIKWIHGKGELIKDQNGKPIYLEGTIQDITEDKNLALSILESNQRFEYVTKATFDAIWDWDLTTDLIYWGEGFNTIFGYDPEEIEPDISSWTNRIHPDDYQRVIKSIHSCINNSTVDVNWTEDYKFLKSNGNYAFVQDKGIVIRDQNGVAIRMVGAIQDITKKKEENLRLQLLESVVTNANDAVLITEAEPFDDYGPRIIYVNEAFTKMTGYMPDDVIGKTPRILQGPKSDKAELKRLSKALRSWQSCEITTINYKKNGDEFYINFSVTPVADSKGWYTHWIAIERDVTEAVVAQQKLKAAYDERNTILESIGDAFFAVDENWIVNYWNTQAERMLATAKHQVIGKNLWDVFNTSISSISYEKYHEALEKDVIINFEDYYEALDNWYDISVYPSNNGLSVYFKDISEKKKAEIKLLELNKTLLKQTKELSISNQELEQFAYVASHDLQEPLRMITSFLTQIEKKYADTIDDKGKQYIHFAVDGAKRMRQIILDLLEFSRVGRLSEDLEEVDVNEVIKDIQSLYRKQIAELSAVLEFDYLPKILSYKTPIRQVLQNLISNGLKYHNLNKAPIIKINVVDHELFWQFSVKDNGIGIEEEYYQKIFIIFQRLHNKDEYSGTGMGLAICKKIVETLGGEIWVKGNADEGSSFHFTIPKAKI